MTTSLFTVKMPDYDLPADHVEGKLCVFLIELLCHWAEVKAGLYTFACDNAFQAPEDRGDVEAVNKAPKDDFTKLFRQVYPLFTSAVQGQIDGESSVIGGEMRSRLINVYNDSARLQHLSSKSQEIFDSILSCRAGDNATKALEVKLHFKNKEIEALAAFISAEFKVLIKDYDARSLVCCRTGYRPNRRKI